jgi:hypothetical protein
MLIYFFSFLYTDASKSHLRSYIDQYEQLITKDIQNNQFLKLNTIDISNSIIISLKENFIEINLGDIRKTIQLSNYVILFNADALFIDILYEIFLVKKLSSSSTLIIEDTSMVKRHFYDLFSYLLNISSPKQEIIDNMIKKYNVKNFNAKSLNFSTVFDINQSLDLFNTILFYKYTNTIRISRDDDFYFFDISFDKLNYNGFINRFYKNLKQNFDEYFEKTALNEIPSFFDFLLIKELSEIPYLFKVQYYKFTMRIYEKSLPKIRGMKFIFGFSKSLYEIVSFYSSKQNIDSSIAFMVLADDKSILINNYLYCFKEEYASDSVIEKEDFDELINYFKGLMKLSSINRKGSNQEIQIILNLGIIKYIFCMILNNHNTPKYIILLHLLKACDCITGSTLMMITKADLTYSFMKKAFDAEIKRIINQSESIDWNNIHSIQYAYLKYFILEEYNLLKDKRCNIILEVNLGISKKLISLYKPFEDCVLFLRTVNYSVFLYFAREYDTRDYPANLVQKSRERCQKYFKMNLVSNEAFENVMMELTSLRYTENEKPLSKKRRKV